MVSFGRKFQFFSCAHSLSIFNPSYLWNRITSGSTMQCYFFVFNHCPIRRFAAQTWWNYNKTIKIMKLITMLLRKTIRLQQVVLFPLRGKRTFLYGLHRVARWKWSGFRPLCPEQGVYFSIQFQWSYLNRV